MVFRLPLVACVDVEPIVGELVEQHFSGGVASQVEYCDHPEKVLLENDHRSQVRSTDLQEYSAEM